MVEINDLLETITSWASEQETVRGVVLVGSHARGTPRPDSDVDIMLLVTDPTFYRTEEEWVYGIGWDTVAATVSRWVDEDYGLVWSRRVLLKSGLEIELSFGPLNWAEIDPVDLGTAQVMNNGHRILYDPENRLKTLVAALA